MARVMSQWKTLFGLTYEDRDDFLAFYLKYTGILYKLKKGDSVIIAGNVSIKAWLTMVIETKELQSEIRSFLKDPSKSYHEWLE